MRFGLQVPRFETPGGPDQIGPAFARLATRAERSGFDSLWVMDHFFQLPMLGPAEQHMLEGYAALAFAAGITERIKLGTLVTGVTYRHPGVLIKQVTTLDVLSGGRAYFGIGAGWYEREHLGLGIPFPPLSERFERLEETVQLARQMWAGDVAPFNGRHYQLAEPLNYPQALSRPHPPILIGGSGEKKTLRLVARYADACNLFAMDLAEVRHKLEVLRQHCETEGRPYDAIEKSTLGPAVALPGAAPLSPELSGWVVSPAQAIDQIGALRELGIGHHIFGGAIDYPEMVDLIAAEVMPHFAKETVTA
ncbi:MAG: LLM class F420-dependent oxidoreductase [Chloroflexota bacterium]|nr:LLM class F420-dependent oxidoreductase [Chloroflexota bacterium]